MSTQHIVQPRYQAGHCRGKGDKDTKNKPDSDFQLEKPPVPGWPTSAGVPGKSVGHTDVAHDRLVFLVSCLIGQRVEVQVKNGSVYSGIFHSTNSGKDFGVILKMAQLKDAAGQKSGSESVIKSPIRTFVIPANELVQVIAKDILVTSDGEMSENHYVKENDILIDSYISQSRPCETERELERWVPDDSDPICSNLDNVFDTPWNRGWDQFQTNETLFGVKSTFNEELYTTKLERGPRTRQLEREALRIAREIEGEETHDLHLAEERGVLLDEKFDIDEESKYSSVLRKMDDGGYEENIDPLADSVNDDTFGVSSTSTSAAIDSALPHCFSTLAEGQQPYSNIEPSNSNSIFTTGDSKARGQEDHFSNAESSSKESLSKQAVVKNAHTSNDEEFDLGVKDSRSKKGSPNVSSSSATDSKERDKTGRTNDSTNVSQFSTSQNEPGSEKSRGQPCVSPSSSVGSLSSEKSTLNPYAKEFKLNPNAKSFVPTKASSSPLPPSSNATFFYPNNVPQMPGMPVGVGIGPSFSGHQPVIYNPQGAPLQSPQGYFHPNAPQYGHHMIHGSAQPVMYMPGYPQEMPYKREY